MKMFHSLILGPSLLLPLDIHNLVRCHLLEEMGPVPVTDSARQGVGKHRHDVLCHCMEECSDYQQSSLASHFRSCHCLGTCSCNAYSIGDKECRKREFLSPTSQIHEASARWASKTWLLVPTKAGCYVHKGACAAGMVQTLLTPAASCG